MNSHIYIADNPTDDMFNTIAPSFDTGVELPPPPANSNYSEMDTFVSKSFTSFGVMAICIILILLIAFIIKKRKTENEQYESSDINTPQEVIQEQQSEPQQTQTRKRRNSRLRTPNTLTKCIKAFLENTKEN